MSKKKQVETKENYTFFYKDGCYVTFSLTKTDFLDVQNAISHSSEAILLENYVIFLSDLRYIAKQEQKEAPQSAVPEYMEQDVYEYLRGLERGKTDEGY